MFYIFDKQDFNQSVFLKIEYSPEGGEFVESFRKKRGVRYGFLHYRFNKITSRASLPVRAYREYFSKEGSVGKEESFPAV